MIEFKIRHKQTMYTDSGWQKCRPNSITPNNFKNFCFRVNGVVHTEWNDKFEAVLFWEKLKR